MEPTAAEPRPTFLEGKRLGSAIVAGGAALAMTLAGLGIAAAQTDDTTTTTPPSSSTAPAAGDGKRHRHGGGHTHADHHPHTRLTIAAKALDLTTAELKAELSAGRSIAQVAEAKGVDGQKVVDALVADATAVVEAAVTEGRLTRERADARIATLPTRMRELVDRVRPDGEARRKERHGPRIKGTAETAQVAEVLGMTVEELRAGRRAGKTLAVMAREQGVDVQTVIDVLVADARARLAQAVTDDKLTQDQADRRGAGLEARITELVHRAGRPHDGHRRGAGARADADGGGGGASEGEPAAFTA